jgi:two-component system, LuxR family, response regulator FixJ
MKSSWNLDGKIVAIVDDHEGVLEAAAVFLEALGAVVLSFKNGRDFLQDIPPVHCLIVDYYMRGLNGLEVALELRKRGYSTPVILLTGMSHEIPEERVAEAGIREVVYKTAGGDALLRAIQCAAAARLE